MTHTEKNQFKAEVKEFARRMGIEIKSLTLRPMKNKWASCSADGRLNFSTDLLNMEKEIQNYVIVHELLHVNIPNHGKLWKSLMSVYLGDYEAIEKKLKHQTVQVTK